MKYSIPQNSESVFDVLAYTIKAMNEVGLMSGEIEDFLSDAISGSNWHLVEASNAQLEDCNRIYNEINGDWPEDAYRDHYYDSSLWDSNDDIEEDTYDYPTAPYSTRRYYWEDDIVDEEDEEEEEEAYEGLDPCSNHHWVCSGDDLDTLAMRREDDDLSAYAEFDPHGIYKDIINEDH